MKLVRADQGRFGGVVVGTGGGVNVAVRVEGVFDPGRGRILNGAAGGRDAGDEFLATGQTGRIPDREFAREKIDGEVLAVLLVGVGIADRQFRLGDAVGPALRLGFDLGAIDGPGNAAAGDGVLLTEVGLG